MHSVTDGQTDDTICAVVYHLHMNRTQLPTSSGTENEY